MIYMMNIILCTSLSLSLSASNRASQLSLPVGGGSQEFDVETSSIQSGQIGSEFDSISIGSIKSEYPKYCVVLYHYAVRIVSVYTERTELPFTRHTTLCIKLCYDYTSLPLLHTGPA